MKQDIKIKECLEKVLPQHTFDLENIEASSIFLILTVKNQKVGFATFNGQPKTDYDNALESFREIYSNHAGEWAKCDLTLVLCKLSSETPSDEFCNMIEIDPYFCRKFVIDLNRDLESELRRLPFTPLSSEFPQIFKTPISAQSFLTIHEMTPDLARYLVVPNTRGVRRIVLDSLEGTVGEPKWQSKDFESFISIKETEGTVVKIKELEVNNFRAYRGKHTFNFDADIVVLFGPNGLGKTSVFDAIDFVCTGGIARFEERFRSNPERLLNTLKHLDSSVSDSSVKIKISQNGEERQIVRLLDNRARVAIDGQQTDRTRALMAFTGLTERPNNIRIDNLVHLFRASHIFGQEYQYLTSKFRENSQLPQDIISRMLAFQDYVEGINKSKKVLGDLKKEREILSLRIRGAQESIEQKKQDIRALGLSAPGLEKPNATVDAGRRLAKRISQIIDVTQDISKEISKETVMSWRSLIGARIFSLNNNLEQATELEQRISTLDESIETLAQDSKELNEKSALYTESEKKLDERQYVLTIIMGKLNNGYIEERTFVSRQDNLIWLLSTKKQYEEIKKKIVVEENNHRDTRAELSSVVNQFETENSNKIDMEQRIEQLMSTIDSSKAWLEKAIELKDFGSDWERVLETRDILAADRKDIGQKLTKLEEIQNSVSTELNQMTDTIDLWENRLRELEQSQTEFNMLLDTIEQYIDNNICPLCGISHESKEELIGRIAIRRGDRPQIIDEALKYLADSNSEKEILDQKVTSITHEISELKRKNENTDQTILANENKINEFHNKAIAIEMPGQPAAFKEAFEQKLPMVTEQITNNQNALVELDKHLIDIKKTVVKVQERETTLSKAIQSCETRLGEMRLTVNEIRNEAQTREVSIETEFNMVQNELDEYANRIKNVHNQIKEDESESKALKDDITILMKERDAVVTDIKQLTDRSTKTKGDIEETNKFMRALNLSGEINTNQIIEYVKETEAQRQDAELLQKDIIEFEIMLDKAGESALLQKAQIEIADSKKKIYAIEKERALINCWSDYYETVSRELESLQNQALTMYAEKYGPLTSNIQRRLRSVYGFGDIELQSSKGGFLVRVERKGQTGFTPTDYFSESQVQILMLGVFLSAALTQTWSSFRPILMDDPVEHFDDLNSYSFVDLMKGLVSDSDKDRQLIVSTCDERLFRLIRQRFANTGERAIFHIFRSIGESGPSYTTTITQ